MRAEFGKDNRGGLTIGIFENGRLAWTNAYGFANEKARIRATDDTVYPVASLTKMITGIMLLQLVERGKVHLADPVERYVPEFTKIPNPFPWTPPVTLIQLATMTSGLETNQPDLRDMPAVSQSDPWEKQVLDALPYLKYDYEPGTKREYSNLGFCILGLALSRAAGRPFTEYIQSEILKPLGMNHSSFSVTNDMGDRVAEGHFLGNPNATPSLVENSERDFQLPAGGLLSTVKDLARLMSFQISGEPETVLTTKTLEAAFEDLVTSDGDLRYGDGVGFAAVRNEDSQLTALGHGGLRRTGFVASYEFDRSTRTGVILLANASHGQADYKPLVRRILLLLHPASVGGTGLKPTEEH
jgi:CubicO group peptidase (beta-lactamase class C family)